MDLRLTYGASGEQKARLAGDAVYGREIAVICLHELF